MLYYLISTKWTGYQDGFLTLWRDNSRGYCWYKQWAGLYNEEEAKAHQCEDVVPIKQDVVDNLWHTIFFDKEDRQVLINTPAVLHILGISSKKLRKDYRSNCPRIYQIDSLK